MVPFLNQTEKETKEPDTTAASSSHTGKETWVWKALINMPGPRANGHVLGLESNAFLFF